MICYFKIRLELSTGIFQYSVISLYMDDFSKCSTVSSSCFRKYRTKREPREIAIYITFLVAKCHISSLLSIIIPLCLL